jgi:acetyl esterase/lipase
MNLRQRRQKWMLIAAAAALGAGAGGCTRFDLLNATIPPLGYHSTRNIAYGPLPRQWLDVYTPSHPALHPGIVIFFYGGDWQTGSKWDYRFVGKALASKGFIAVLPDYRLYPAVTFPAFVQDGAAAVRWVHDHASAIGGSAQRVYLMGHSAGAHIAALLTLDPSYLQAQGLKRSNIRATAALSGPYEFVPEPDDRGVFGMSANDTNPYPAMEPINFVDGREPPMLLVQGSQDKTVNPQNAYRLAERIRQTGGSVQLIIYPKRAHVGVVLSLAFTFRWLAPTLADACAFFDSH